MSFRTRQESAMVEALSKGRAARKKIGPPGMKSQGASEQSQLEEKGMQPPPPPSLSAKDEEIALVKTLEVTKYDGNRKFPGLAKQKIEKKDRHRKALDEFTKFLDDLAGAIEQDVLRLSRQMMEDVEKVDQNLAGSYKLLQDQTFLIPKSEDDLKDMLKDLKMTVAGRLNIVNTFGEDLDGLEIKRAEKVGRRLKELVDTLVSIAHQLPDEIEHTAESQIFDLNTVLTTNRKSHSDLLGILRKTQVEVEIETIQRWEDGRKYWRQLRHDKGLADFIEDILSKRFTAPTDRIEYLTSVKDEQELRQERRLKQLKDISELNADSINSKAVVAFQEECAVIADDELDAVQACYGRMGELREGLKDTAERRVEELRKELHVYGALHLEPPFREVANSMQEALDEEDLAELWRLGGGLKPDFAAMNKDMCSVDLAYSDFVRTIEKRLEVIVCGFNFKAVLEGRGRLMQLDKLRTLNTKLRTVPKGEVPSVIASIVPEIKEVVEYEKLTDKFVEVLTTTVAEMEAEVERVKNHPANADPGGSTLGGSATLGASDSTQSMRRSSTVATSASASMKTGKSGKSSSRGGTAASIDMTMFVDQTMVKAWNRILGILFYGADLTPAAREACQAGFKYCGEQHECNRLVDEAVLKQSAKELDLMSKRYKRLNDDIANFLEAQANYMAVCLTNMGSFFLDVAKAVEAHRTQQIALDNKSEDLLHELKEDFRIEREDREVVYESACQRMRESVSLEELQDNFEAVLTILDEVQESYRVYHGNACFAADKYPLSLADDFKNFVELVGSKFAMRPQEEHEILLEYNAVFDETIRLNQRFFAKDINAGGVPPRAPDIAAFKAAVAAKSLASGESKGEGGDEEGENGGGDEEADATAAGETAAEDGEGSVGAGAVPGGSLAGSEEAKDAASAATLEEYVSPLKAANSKKKKSNAVACFCGNFDVTQSLSDFTSDLTIEKDEDDAPAEGEAAAAAPSTKAAPIPHPDCVFVRKTFERGIPLSAEEEAALDEYDLYDYEKALSKAFIALEEEQQSELEEGVLSLYQHVSARVAEITERLKREEDPNVLRKNVPMCVVDDNSSSSSNSNSNSSSSDGATTMSAGGEGETETETEVEAVKGDPWVLQFEIDLKIMQGLIGGLRDSLVTSVEVESEGRLKKAEKIKVDNKQKFTDELEDRLRTHWPRRGRVETGIKQPREAELLGHAEKTYRHIESIHEKMIAIQRHFVKECDTTRQKCDDYVAEVTSTGDYVTTTTFRNLAVLQGIEVKARGLWLSFQATNARQLKAMKHIANDEVNAVIQYAVDFKKVCPKQEPGVEGGYSEAELEEIEALVNGQCEEARTIQEEWNAEIDELAGVQAKSLESHGEFTIKYEETVQSVAMSEGLGQKYGAPRRRAQERIRSEVVRDEQSAGKIDEMLAKIEFICDEVKRVEEIQDGDSVMPGSVAASVEAADNGYSQMEKLKDAWHLLCSIRKAAQTRVDYLEIVETPLDTPALAWITDRIAKVDASVDGSSLAFESAVDEGGDADGEDGEFQAKKSTIAQVMVEVDEACRSETRDLYESEGKGDMLGDGGVPESLATWLDESKDKILGRHGHKEKAWKRLWGQIERFEAISGRVLEEIDPDTPTPPKNLPAPGACMRLIGDAMVRNMGYVRDEEERKFRKLVATFEAARDKHERLLRPRLGSPDAADELNELDNLEKGRSKDFSEAVTNFRAELVRELVDQACKFCEDMSVSSTALIQYLDSSLRLEAIQLPPDTAVPKKRMTLKRLRKAQRLKAAIEAGEEDRSKERDWPPLNLDALVTTCRASEDIAVGASEPPPAEPVEEAPVKGKGKGKAGAAAEPEKPAGPPPLLPQEWIDSIKDSSVGHGSVTTAHRSLISERDRVVVEFVEALHEHLQAIRKQYSTLLSAEESWIGRWKNQVGMLRSGDL